MFDVIGFGALNLDRIYTVESLPAISDGLDLAPGSERVIDDGEYDTLLQRLETAGTLRATAGGGQAANAVYALAQMGFRTALIGSAGADDEGDLLLAELAPIDTTYVTRAGRSAGCLVIVDEQGERTIRLRPAVDSVLPDAVTAWKKLDGAHYIHLTSLIEAEGPVEQVRLLQNIPDSAKVSFDPGELYCRLGAKALEPLLRRSYILFAGESEADLLVGTANVCDELLNLGSRIVVCKKGAAGVEVANSDGDRFSLPAKETPVVDTTGAGDVFAAGFLAGLMLDLDQVRCAALGIDAAARSVGGYGRSSYPGPELIKAARPKKGRAS